MKFLIDGMLGKLARWLRLAGQDVVSINDLGVGPEEEDDFLLDSARGKSRVLVTRDQDLYRRAMKENIRSILIRETEDVAKQLLKISESVNESIEIEIGDSRCPVCNGELESVEKSSVSEEVPEISLENNERFWRCESCGKVYWPGGHWENIAETVEKYENLKG